MKIFVLFYMCHFAMGLTHCYKTTVFFYIYVDPDLRRRRDSTSDVRCRVSVWWRIAVKAAVDKNT